MLLPPLAAAAFDPLSSAGRTLCFPCDARGQVDLDRLGERARSETSYARTVIGRDFARPAVQTAALH